MDRPCTSSRNKVPNCWETEYVKRARPCDEYIHYIMDRHRFSRGLREGYLQLICMENDDFIRGLEAVANVQRSNISRWNAS